MKLVALEVAGYRSIREPLTFILEPNVTVVVGANDHGKSNVLRALRHLNMDAPLESEDVNWDCEGSASLPSLRFTLDLTPDDLLSLQNVAGQASFDARVAQLASDHRAAAAEAWGAYENYPAKIDEHAELEELESSDEAGLSASQKSRLSALRKIEDSRQSQDEKLRLAAAEQEERAALFEALSREALGPHRVAESIQSQIDLASAAVSQAQRAAVAAKEARSVAAKENQEANASGDSNRISAATTALKEAQRAAEAADDHVGELETELETLGTAWQRIGAEGIMKLVGDYAKATTSPRQVTVGREGLGAELQLVGDINLDAAARYHLLNNMLPRVELIEPVEHIPDSSTFEQLLTPEHSFMRGIFHYAGLARNTWEGLFEQTPRTARVLDKASDQLNRTLKENWSQGQELRFQLRHDSKSARINLEMEDPNVSSSYVRPSTRSSGFTHFFSLKTILNARIQDSSANSFIWVFDEPGVYLHPHGQSDLIQVLETIGQHNQVVYSTHSIFMINRNFPGRHRLVRKLGSGTRLESKAFSGNWHNALASIGLSLPSTILFSPKVLLVEGDSDPMLLWSALQRLSHLASLNFDWNLLSIMSTGESRHLDAFVRMLKECKPSPGIAALFDGDEGGKRRMEQSSPLREMFGLDARLIGKELTLEDLLPCVEELMPQAVAAYVSKVYRIPLTQATEAVANRPNPAAVGRGKKTVGWAKWSRQSWPELDETKGSLSAVGIAREYCHLLEAKEPGSVTEKAAANMVELIRWIGTTLALPARVLEQDSIVEPATDPA